AASDDVVERIAAGCIPAQSLILAAQFNDLRSAANRNSYFVNQGVRSFLYVVESARLHGLHGRIEITGSGDEHNGRLGGQAMWLLQPLDAVDFRHFNISDDYIVASAFHLANRELARAYRLDLVSFFTECNL